MLDPQIFAKAYPFAISIALIFIALLGVGGGAKIFTNWLSRQKIAADASVISADAKTKLVLADKTSAEAMNEVVEEYKIMLSNEKARHEEEEKKNSDRYDKIEKRLEEVQAKVEKLQAELTETREALSTTQNHNAVMNSYIVTIKGEWNIHLPETPFPQAPYGLNL